MYNYSIGFVSLLNWVIFKLKMSHLSQVLRGIKFGGLIGSCGKCYNTVCTDNIDCVISCDVILRMYVR